MRCIRGAFAVAIIVLLFEPQGHAQSKIRAEALMVTVDTLAAGGFEGRRTGTAGGLKARQWLLEQFTAIGLSQAGAGYLVPFTFRRGDAQINDAANIVGVCKGREKRPDVLVVSAHYDHVGVRNGEVFHGADDNASGVAVLLELARHCVRQPFARDVIFVAFDAEEMGLQGARAFVANPPVAKEQIALNINLDMVARGDKGELYAAGPHHWPATRPALETVAKRAPVKLSIGHDQPGARGNRDDWTSQSDHGVFHAAGIPFVYFGVEDHPDYHRPSDTADKINPAFFERAAQTILDAVMTLDGVARFAK